MAPLCPDPCVGWQLVKIHMYCLLNIQFRCDRSWGILEGFAANCARSTF